MEKDEEIKDVLKQIAEENENTNRKEKDNNKESQTKTGCLLALIFMLIIIFVVFKAITGFWNSLGNEKTSSSSTPSDYKMEAYVMSQDFMEDYLKNPSTAKFPWYSDINVVQTGNRYKVEAYVDSQNSFGANVRTSYYMILERSDDGGWTKISCDIK